MHMWCPDGIGREVWGRGGRKSGGWLEVNSPQGLGEEALAEVCQRVWLKRVGPS